MIKATGLVESLENVEQVVFNFSLPYSHDGYTNDSLIVHFKDYENGEPRESQMYLFNKTSRQWEFKE